MAERRLVSALLFPLVLQNIAADFYGFPAHPNVTPAMATSIDHPPQAHE